MSSSEIRVALIDDHEVVLQGLSALLNSHSGINVISTHLSGHDAIAKLPGQTVDVIITDINMPDLNGFETAASLREAIPNARLIALSMEYGQAHRNKAQDQMLSGYVSKSAPVEEVVSAIKTVYSGGTYFNN